MPFFKKTPNENNNNDPMNGGERVNNSPVKNSPAPSVPAPDAGQAHVQNTAPQPNRPQYQTPEGFNFNRYFLAERRVFLENVSYDTSGAKQVTGGIRLEVKDTILSQIIGTAGVRFTFNRSLRFDPAGPFTLSVTFGVMLVFNPGTRGEIDWRTIDLSNEFKKNCPELVAIMTSKAALLIAEITNADNAKPIITPHP